MMPPDPQMAQLFLQMMQGAGPQAPMGLGELIPTGDSPRGPAPVPNVDPNSRWKISPFKLNDGETVEMHQLDVQGLSEEEVQRLYAERIEMYNDPEGTQRNVWGARFRGADPNQPPIVMVRPQRGKAPTPGS